MPLLRSTPVSLRVAAAVCCALAAVPAPAALAGAPVAPHAEFGRAAASPDAHRLADWIVEAGDNAGRPFFIVDKRRARLYAFDAAGHLNGDAPVLLGLARGDETVPGIGDKKIADIKPEERTTPAGRFVAEFGQSSSRGEDVVWVDYDAAVSMHRVVTSNPKERRLQRLATPTAKDNRISYGCINLPKAFYETYVGPLVAQTRTIVYVLPETRPARQVFAFLDTKNDSRSRVARSSAAAKSMRAGPPDGSMPIIDQ
jgi:hypothetical protein